MAEGETQTKTEEGQQTTPPGSSNGGVKMIPETDLLDFKRNNERHIAELNNVHTTELEQIRNELAATKQSVLSLQAVKEKLEADAKNFSDLSGKVNQLEADLTTARQSGEGKDAQLLDLRKKGISLEYNVSLASMEGKNLAQLDSYEEALKAVKGSTGAGIGNYAAGGGGASGSPKDMKPIDRAKAVLDEGDRKRGLKRDEEGHLI